MTPTGIPPAEIEINDQLIRQLLRADDPDLAELPIQLAAVGWDNATYRLGEKLAVRLPRISGGAALIRHEQAWLPTVARWLSQVPVSIPVPLRCGRPGPRFGWPWSIVPWIPGQSAEHEAPSADQAALFGRFLATLHRPAPSGFPRNDYRGVPLSTKADPIEAGLVELAEAQAAPGVEWEIIWRLWREARSAPHHAEDLCIHGDLHPKNIIVEDGRLAAVIDWGDLTHGDPATDLSAIWMLFPTPAHQDFWRSYGPVDEPTKARSIGWAVWFGVTLASVGLAGDLDFARIGATTLRRLCGAQTGSAWTG